MGQRNAGRGQWGRMRREGWEGDYVEKLGDGDKGNDVRPGGRGNGYVCDDGYDKDSGTCDSH